ncbi:MAG: HIT family protein [Lachnospiraceae bacterium]
MKDNDCIFCKIANGDIPAATVYEDQDCRVILDMSPASRGHALILPKQHFKDLSDADPNVTARILPLAGRVGTAMKKGLGAAGFNVVSNNGTSAGQTVFHLHVHVIPRYENGPTMISWEPGTAETAELRQISESITNKLQ